MTHAVPAGVTVASPAASEAPRLDYIGLVTRAIAFTLDAALINAVAIVVAAAVALTFSVFHLPQDLEVVAAAIGAAAYVLWSLLYFVTFWASTGQTPGNHVMRIRVCVESTGLPPRPWRATLRLGAMFLAAIPLLAGYLTILTDARRRSVPDMLVGTVVCAADE